MSGFLKILLILFTWNFISVSSERRIENPSKPDWINFATSRLKSILRKNGISDLPKGSNHILPPNYMIELYHKKTKENFLQLFDKEISTVRCIMSKIKRETLNFNLSSLSSNDNISRAEIMVFRKKSRQGKLPRIKFFLSNHKTKSYASRKYLMTTPSLPSTTGWQTIDVSKILKSSFRKWETLGLSIESLIPEFGTGDEIYYPIQLDQLLRISYRPFLVIFSTDKESKNEDDGELLVNSWEDTDEDDDEDEDEETEEDENKKKRESNRIPILNDYNFQINHRTPQAIGENNELENRVNPILTLTLGKKEKKKRGEQVVENETGPGGDDPGEILRRDDNEISVRDQFGPPFLTPHFLKRRSIGDNSFSSKDFLSYLSSIQKSKEGSGSNGLLSSFKPNNKIHTKNQNKMDNTILLPPLHHISWNHRKKNRKGRRRSNQKSKGYNLPQFNSSRGDHDKVDMKKLDQVSAECRMQEYSIALDFDWAEQIIAPASFPFNYCTGTCSYAKENDGVVEKVDFCEEEIINPWVLSSFLWPTDSDLSNACCIPRKYGRLSLLFVDKYDTILMKTFPNATITGCSCRS